MNQSTRIVLIVTGAVVAGAILLLGGMFIGRSSWGWTGFWPGNMMGTSFAAASGGPQFNLQRGPGMMGATGQVDPGNLYYGYGMMGSFGQVDPENPNYGYRMMGGYGMMGPGMMSTGMMGGYRSSGLLDVEPLTLADAQQAVQNYLDGLNNPDLILGEIMIFDNHAYAQIVEQSSGIGAMEVLIDPVTKAVYPEHGPNMMWNLKYGYMSGFGMMGGLGQGYHGMMGGISGTRQPVEISGDMPVSPDQAVASAQQYLDTFLPGTEADDHADPFYGYYTLHILRDGEVVGMLSVNGFTSQVFIHTWHGEFLEMSESNHD